MVYGINFESTWCREPKELKKHVFEFFKNHINNQKRYWKMDVEMNFKTLSMKEARRLEAQFSLESLK